MDAPLFTGLVSGFIGTALLVAALLLRGQPAQRRRVLAFFGILFDVYGALEWFKIIHLATL